MRFCRPILVVAISSAVALPTVAHAAPSLWAENAAETNAAAIEPGRRLLLDVGALRRFVDVETVKGAALAVPRPDGGYAQFALEDSGTMPPELAAKFPEIRSLKGIDADGNRIRVDISPLGFQAMVFGHDGDVWVVQPENFEALAAESSRQSLDVGVHAYVSVRRADVASAGFRCAVGDEKHDHAKDFADAKAGATIETVTGGNRRTMRLALAATGEYTAKFGGTVAGGLAAITTAVNRVNQVYERDFSVRMTLVPNNNLLVYTNASTDPYTNNNGSTMLGQNQTNVTSVIGSANYDIGHVFSTGGGGVAGLGVICSSGNKARGVTGSSNPVGDPFYIDYVAHEMGHQFGGNHTFNSTSNSCGGGNRNASTAYETGSGSTIMAYAGICGTNDLQPNSDPYFHAKSLEEIGAKLAATTCGTSTANPNAAPVIAPLATSYVIPAKTPFALTASATDADGDALTYAWEQYDLGAATNVGVDNGTSPIARSFNPAASGTRTLPRLSNLLANTAATGEILPQVNRTAMKYRVTVRDGHAGGGATVSADIPPIRVVLTSAPFAVTAPNTAVTWTAGTAQNVTWNVGGTTAAPISCANVDIALSKDGGNTFPTALASNVANSGTRSVTVPAGATSQARVRVQCRGNIFFDVSNANFTIN
ncbi:reprolysin-like metallopeptidase [Tahibacter soli]|uniref:M12 family metallo-peptidase n=1 Tax=Tahibacter soli TaxID=2983605 RepID=A0A9X3YKB5_9GAMM|nr:zinc-dependent metalloprotease family protein [Tahibacter soli]MDC8013956.1 M12 family metallo-peptidase [Tahibacter soli]